MAIGLLGDFRLQSARCVAGAGLGPAIRDNHVTDDVRRPTPPLHPDWTRFAMPACLNRPAFRQSGGWPFVAHQPARVESMTGRSSGCPGQPARFSVHPCNAWIFRFRDATVCCSGVSTSTCLPLPFLRSCEPDPRLIGRFAQYVFAGIDRKSPGIFRPHRIVLHQIAQARLCTAQYLAWQCRCDRSGNGFQIGKRVADPSQHGADVELRVKISATESGDADI